GAQVLLEGTLPGEPPQPLAWTFIRSDGGRAFYTSLGHVDDFKQSQFEALLSAGIHWACGLSPHTLQTIEDQNQRYASGHGKQRESPGANASCVVRRGNCRCARCRAEDIEARAFLETRCASTACRLAQA